jgi:hypothetical protein
MLRGVLIQEQETPVAFNRRTNAASLRTLFVAIALFACTMQMHADGGTVQFERTAGLFVITVFTTPSPLRAGAADISLMVQDRESRQPMLDCQALVQLHKKGAMSISSAATHEAAQNKLLYAAQVNIPEPGDWELEVLIEGSDHSASVTGPIAVASSRPFLLTFWRSLALPPIVILLFGLNQWLKRREKVKRQR